MEFIKNLDFSHFIEQLRAQHPRLLLIVGEQHNSKQSKPLQKQLLQQADIGFFEQPSDMMDGIPNGMPRDMATQFVKFLEDRGDLASAEFAKPWTYPATTVTMDENETIRKKAGVALAALDRLNKDGVPKEDEVHSWVSTIADHRVEQRLITSNAHMADIMGKHMDEKFSNGKPFFAVAIVGSGHIRPGNYGRKGTECDMKHVLSQKGYDVVVLDMQPVPPHGALAQTRSLHDRQRQ